MPTKRRLISPAPIESLQKGKMSITVFEVNFNARVVARENLAQPVENDQHTVGEKEAEQP